MREDLMNWKKSRMFSVLTLSSMAWMQMKLPVRPTPSLHTQQHGRSIAHTHTCDMLDPLPKKQERLTTPPDILDYQLHPTHDHNPAIPT